GRHEHESRRLHRGAYLHDRPADGADRAQAIQALGGRLPDSRPPAPGDDPREERPDRRASGSRYGLRLRRRGLAQVEAQLTDGRRLVLDQGDEARDGHLAGVEDELRDEVPLPDRPRGLDPGPGPPRASLRFERIAVRRAHGTPGVPIGTSKTRTTHARSQSWPSASISTSAPDGRAVAWIVARAGGSCPSCSR